MVKRYNLRPMIDGDNVLDWPRDLRHGPSVVLASDYDALAARLAEVEQSRGNWIVECRAYEDKARHLRDRIAEAERLLRGFVHDPLGTPTGEPRMALLVEAERFLRASDSASETPE